MYILYLYTLFIYPYIRISKWSKVIFVAHNGQISQKEHGLNKYVIMKKIALPGITSMALWQLIPLDT